MTDAAAPDLDARIDAQRAETVKHERGTPEYRQHVDALEALYRERHPEPVPEGAATAPAPGAPAVLTGAAADSRMEALRSQMLGMERGSPEWKAAMAEYEGLLTAKWPEPSEAGASPATDTTAPQAPLAEPDAEDVQAVTEAATVYGVDPAHQHDLARVHKQIRTDADSPFASEVLDGGMHVLNRLRMQREAGERMSEAEADAMIAQAWGDAGVKEDSALKGWSLIPPAVRESIAWARQEPEWLIFLADAYDRYATRKRGATS